MKIGVSSYSFSSYRQSTGADEIRLCDLALEMGFEGIEFIDLQGDDLIARAKAIRAHCQAIGLSVVAYTVGANFLAGDPAAEAERVKRCVDVAAALGAPVMRHDAGWGFADRVHARTWREAVALIAGPIREVAEYAAGKGVKTCTENHGYFMQDSNRVEQLMRTVNHPNYGWLVDMGNFLCADEDCLTAVATAAPYAFHVHAKDFLLKSGASIDPGEGWFRSRGGNYLRGTVVGHGVVPVPQCISILKASGYDGWLSLEFEGHEDNLPAIKHGLAFLKRFA